MSDLYQPLIDAVSSDPEYPAGVVATPLPSRGVVHFQRAADKDADQWQIAIPAETAPEDALLLLITQQDRAEGRVRAQAWRAERQATERAAQQVFHDRMRNLGDQHLQRIAAKKEELGKRLKKGESGGR